MKKNGGFRQFPGAAAQQQAQPLQIQVGHNGTMVVCLFSHPVKTLGLTETEVESHVANLQEALQKLREKKANG